MTDLDLIRRYGPPHDAHVQAWVAQDPQRLAGFVQQSRDKNAEWERERKAYRLDHPYQPCGTGNGIRAPKY